jgi:hypothetical protein
MKNNILFIYLFISCVSLSAQTLSGTIFTTNPTDSILCNVDVFLLDSAEHVLQQTTTDSSGNYSIDLPDSNNSYLLRVEKEGEAELRNGVSAIDLVLLSRYLLGVSSIDDERLLKVGDVNAMNGLTTFDIVMIRKVIMGIDSSFIVPTWRFYLTDPTLPFSDNLFELNGATTFDLVAYKTGDLNVDAQTCP